MMTRIVLGVLLTVTSTATFATDKESKTNYLQVVQRVDGDSYKIIYQSEKVEPVLVSIKNDKGITIARERFSKTQGFILPLNLKNVESGKYNVEIKSKSSQTKAEIDHLSKSDDLRSKLFLQTKNGMFALVGYDLKSSDLTVYVYSDNDDLIHVDHITTDGVLNQQFNIKVPGAKWLRVAVFHQNDLLFQSRVKRD